MKMPLHVVHVEDNATDAALAESLLDAGGISCKVACVKTRESFLTALGQEKVDLILSDFSMPGFDGLSALEVARARRPEVPFIFLSGTIGEEIAIDALKRGATDYVLKDRMSRLPSSVQRAVREARELTERRRIEEELRKSEERFQLAARATNDVVWDWNFLTHELWWSDNFQKQFGYHPDTREPGTESWYRHIHPLDKERVLGSIHAAISTGLQTWSDEYRFLRADGSIAYVFDRSYIVRDQQGQPIRIIGAMTDITNRKQAEEKIRGQAALLDKAQDAICLKDMAQQILYWNKSAERLYGWTAKEALGHNADDLLYQGESASSIKALHSLIRYGEWQGEEHQVAKGGRKLTVESRWTLLRDEHGEPKSILIINTDVTEKKQIEARFLRTQRLETIGALAGGIAHDLNNALTPVLMAGNLLRQDAKSPETRQLLDMMTSSARRGAEMVRQILSFSRGVSGEHTAIAPEQLIKEMSRLAQETFSRSIKIQTRVPQHLHTITGNSTQLHQVLLNLCVNARDAMPQGGSLTIEAENVFLNPEDLPAGAGLNPGPYVVFKVSDTGHGIAPELLEKIFEPFFTTKDLTHGTGLGLSTVLGIVKTHGGFVNVASEIGRGTTFKVFLPVNVSAESFSASPEKPVLLPGQGELLLLVDDEAAILELTKLTLETFTYRVLIAKNGAEALEVYHQHQHDIAAVLTDMMMPVMNGPEMIKVLRAINPAIKILVMSGLDSEPVVQKARDLRTDAFLKKPFTTELLLKELRRVIEATALA